MLTNKIRSFKYLIKPGIFSMKAATMILFVMGSFIAKAQDEAELINFLNSGKNDASKLIRAYMNPVAEGLSYGLNGGWYNTAKAHKTLGFDLGVSINAVYLPTSQNFFRPADLGLEVTTLTTPADGRAPTLIGPQLETSYTATLETDNGPASVTFNGPEGVDFKKNLTVSGVLVPTAQLGIGIYKNTDLKIRFLPELEFGASKLKMIGFGVLHDVKQHIPGIKMMPFDLAMFVGFTKVKGSSSLEGKFDSGSDPREQLFDYSMNAWIIQALISKKVSVLTVYGGVGYNAIKSSSNITGSYVISTNAGDATFRDPVSMDFKNKSFRLTGGLRIKLGVFYLNGEYTLQEYSTLSVGLGFAFR